MTTKAYLIERLSKSGTWMEWDTGIRTKREAMRVLNARRSQHPETAIRAVLVTREFIVRISREVVKS